MILLFSINAFILIKENNNFILKSLMYPIFFLSLIIVKNIEFAIIVFETLMLLTILNIKTNKAILVLFIFMDIIVFFLAPIVIFASLIPTREDLIYEETHFYCKEYEIYSYSLGAMDEFHYYIGERFDFRIGNLLEIEYTKKIGDSETKYYDTLNDTCIPVDKGK